MTKSSSSRSSKRAKSESVLCLSCDEQNTDSDLALFDDREEEEETDPGSNPFCQFHKDSAEGNIGVKTCCQVLQKHVNQEFREGMKGRVRICLHDDCSKHAISGFSTCVGHGATLP